MEAQVLVLSLGDHETKNTDQCTQKTVKRGGSSIMIWASFSYYGVGPIHCIKTIMDQYVYVDIHMQMPSLCGSSRRTMTPSTRAKKLRICLQTTSSILWNGLHSLRISIQLRICGLSSKRQFTLAIQHLMKLYGWL